jgi:hypothetical protein
MSSMPLATLSSATLADVIDETLASGLAGRAEPCLWCGGAEIRVLKADIWSGEVTTLCRHCGSELSGVVPRSLREVCR